MPITEFFTCGMRTEHEMQTLRMGAGVPALRYTGRHIADDGRIVGVTRPIARRNDTTVADFGIDLAVRSGGGESSGSRTDPCRQL
ncbi:hypothetical protein GTU99_06285 [Streptomyces sp. PRKS01-65]|nr:hypothetical protein [Streptomyces harenosi]NEY31810.1 hypothetical protein [Streptomyces harenosi]